MLQDRLATCPTAPRDALAEVRASRVELQALVAGVFDRIDELARRQVGNLPHGTDEETIQGPIDQLAAVAAELAALVAEQKRLAGQARAALGESHELLWRRRLACVFPIRCKPHA